MKSPRVLAVVIAIVLAAVFNTAVPVAQPKGERVTVTGEVVEMWCYLEAGDRGAAIHRQRGVSFHSATSPVSDPAASH
jgi:hypothetical protein